MCDDLCKNCIDERDTPRTIFQYGLCEECFKKTDVKSILGYEPILNYYLDNVKPLNELSIDKRNYYIKRAEKAYKEAKKFAAEVECWERDEAELKAKKEMSKNFKGWSFITLGPTPFFDFTDESKAKLVEWCNMWINETNYSAASWVIESGKNPKKPNLHLHFFCRIKNPRHHKRDLIHSWDKFFPNNKLVGNNYHIVKCNTEAMFHDKQEYMVNNSKGTHENFIDLQLRGGFGGLGVSTSQ